MSPPCDQHTVRGDLCTHRAAWLMQDVKRGEWEHYCARHANTYGLERLLRIGSARVKPVQGPDDQGSRT